MKKTNPILQLYPHPAAGPEAIFFKGGLRDMIRYLLTRGVVAMPHTHHVLGLRWQSPKGRFHETTKHADKRKKTADDNKNWSA